MRALLALLLALAAAPAAAELAMHRPVATVEEATIRLADLFDGVGEAGTRAVGPAPPPGRRIVVETGQLLAIARLHGVAWRPMSAQDRVVVERPGRPVPREEVEALLRADLAPLGLPPEAELELTGYAPPLVPAAAFAQLALEHAALDPATGRFSALLAVAAEGMPTARLRLVGRAVPTAPVVLSARRLALGDVVREEDLREVRLRADRVRAGVAAEAAQVVGRALRRPVGEGLPFPVADLVTPAVVARNETVLLLMEGPGLAMTAQGRAMEAAGLGEVLPVMNLASRRVVEGRVLGPGRVRVGP